MKRFSTALSMSLILFLTQFNHVSASQQELIGLTSARALLDNFQIFETAYHQYELNEDEEAALNNLPSGISLKVYFGTWCHDSQREVPRLLKSLQSMENQSIDIELYGLDIKKSDPLMQAQKHGIRFTPTIIIYKDELEVGRIIERPIRGLMQDIRLFLSKK